MLHADDVAARLLRLCAAENIPHGGLRERSGGELFSGKDGWIDGQVAERERKDVGMDGIQPYLEIICNKTVDDRIHTAIQTAEGDSQVVDYHMMRHVRVEVHHHLQREKTTQIVSSEGFLKKNKHNFV